MSYYYLALLAFPILTVLGDSATGQAKVRPQSDSGFTGPSDAGTASGFLTDDFISGLFILTGCAGILLSLYIYKIRLDVIWYAQSLNGIRRYFFEKSDLKQKDEKEIEQYIRLPRVVHSPKAPIFSLKFSLNLFFWFLNTAYIIFGVFLLPLTPLIFSDGSSPGLCGVCDIVTAAIVLIGLQVALFWIIARDMRGKTDQLKASDKANAGKAKASDGGGADD